MVAVPSSHVTPLRLAKVLGILAIVDVALFTAVTLMSLFLIEVSIFTWTVGVALRSMTLIMVFGMLGIGVLNMRFNKALERVP